MKKRHITVSVGIPAYNEQQNIGRLLRTILAQRGSFTLEKIIVVSDCSTDNTESEVRKIQSRKISLVVNRKRIGQALSQNKMVKRSTSDIFIILNADILIKDKNFIMKMIDPFTKHHKVGIVSPNILPLSAANIFERIINHSVYAKYFLYRQINKGNNLHMCHGRARAFSKEFLKHLTWKQFTAEDAYSYLVCVRNNFLFVFQPKTSVYYKSPATFADHTYQSARYLRSGDELAKYFDVKFIRKHYTFPKGLYIKTLAWYFIFNPFYAFSYAVILFCVIVYDRFSKIGMWDVATTSKRLTQE